MSNRTYVAIDLKSFYASVECLERGLDPMTTNLVVADESRTEKTICLAVTPSLKAYGISGRSRLFEVVKAVKDVNTARQRKAQNHIFVGSSYDSVEIANSPELSLDYIVAPPQMARYMKCSTEIYAIYLKYIAPEDIHVYSIDEVFMELTNYLQTYHLTAEELVKKIISDVIETTGITATAGIGSNLYLAKIAMDIKAKHIPTDKDGVCIARLDEMSYRQSLWAHRPITDFWRVGRGYAKKLAENGIFTMGDIARCSVASSDSACNEKLLYKLFGVNAELLIDHAWGWEPCSIADIKAYKPQTNSMGLGQVLHSPYSFEKAKIVIREMVDVLALDLLDKRLVTDQIVLTVGYDIENLLDSTNKSYKGEITTDRYGRKIPKQAHKSRNLERYTSSMKIIWNAVSDLFDEIVDKNLSIRRLNLTANRVIEESSLSKLEGHKQLDLFTDNELLTQKEMEKEQELEREKTMQEAILVLNKKYGKGTILKGTNLQEGATAKERFKQIGGHKA